MKYLTTCLVGVLHLLTYPVVGAVKIPNGITRIITIPRTRHKKVLLCFRGITTLCFWSKNVHLKRHVIEKWKLFDLLTTDVNTVIGDWLAGLENSVKFNIVVMQINSTNIPGLHISTYENQYCLPYFGSLSLYDTILYKWVGRLYKKSEYGWGTDLPWVRHKHG